MEPVTGLSRQERDVLEFERGWWQQRGAATKANAIRAQLGLSATRYYAVLAGLLDSPAARAHDPLVVGRLRRKRSEERRHRVTGEVPRRSQPR